MTREELLALAALDAYGLLDRYEAELYTRSFHHAAAGVQDEIRDLQADIAADSSTLPAEMAPPQLRQKVLDAVARAIEQEDARLVIAKIGGRRDEREAPRPQRTGLLAAWFGSSSQFWRAAVFALMGALIAMAYNWNETRREAQVITDLAVGRLTVETISDLETLVGNSFTEAIFDSSTRFIPFDATAASNGERGTIVLDEAGFTGMLVFDRLAKGKYTLEVSDQEGDRHVVKFASKGGLSAISLTIASSIDLPGRVWTIKNDQGVGVLGSA